MPNIVKKWDTVTQDQVRALVKVEPPSLLARASVFTVNLSNVGIKSADSEINK